MTREYVNELVELQTDLMRAVIKDETHGGNLEEVIEAQTALESFLLGEN